MSLQSIYKSVPCGLPGQDLLLKVGFYGKFDFSERQKIVSISHCESYHTKTYHSWLNLDHASSIFNFNWENSNQFQTRSAHKAARLGQKKVRDSI